MAATVAFLMSDPEQARETLGALTQNPRVRELVADSSVRADLVSGDPEALSRVAPLRSLAEDPAFVTAARRLRLIPEGAAPTVSPQELAAFLSERVGPLVRVADAVAKDPEVRAVLDDPALFEALGQGDLAVLLAHGRLDRILERLSRELQRGR
jgi:hypothetical protein